MHIKLGENTRITAHDVKGDLPTSEANRKSISAQCVACDLQTILLGPL